MDYSFVGVALTRNLRVLLVGRFHTAPCGALRQCLDLLPVPAVATNAHLGPVAPRGERQERGVGLVRLLAALTGAAALNIVVRRIRLLQVEPSTPRIAGAAPLAGG